MFGIDDVLELAPSLISGAATLFGGESTNSANAAQAQMNRDFQASMSNTSYQRAVADMKAAGLSPMLAYSQGGASTPSGSMAVMQNAAKDAVAAGQAGAKVRPEVALTNAQTANTQETTKKVNAEEAQVRSQKLLNDAQTLKTIAETRTTGSTANNLDELTKRLSRENEQDIGGAAAMALRNQGVKSHEEAAAINARTREGGPAAEVKELVARARAHSASAANEELQRSGYAAEDAINRSSYGSARPLLKDIGSGVSSAAQLRFGVKGLQSNSRSVPRR